MKEEFCEHSGVKLDLKIEDIKDRQMVMDLTDFTVPCFVIRRVNGRNEKYEIKTNFVFGFLEMSLVSK